MKNYERPPSYLARIREFEDMAAGTKNVEMVGVLRRLVRAYREVASSEICTGSGGAGTRAPDFTPARAELRPVLVARGEPRRIQALTRG